MIQNIKSQTDLSGFYIVYDGSVQNERVGTRGISHLMEHLMYKGNKKLWNVFDNYGINFNAFTSNTNVVFYITGLDKYINHFKSKFIEGISKFNIDEKVFNNEKKIVIEEYYDSFSSPQESHYLNLNRKLYNNYSAIGSIQDLKKLKLDNCYEYFDSYLDKPSKIINISRSTPYIDSIQFKDKYDYTYKPNKPESFEFEQNNQHLNKYSLIYTSPVINNDFNKIDFVISMLSFGLESPFYKYLREKNGLIYGIDMSIDQLTENSGVIHISTLTNKPEQVKQVIEHIFRHYNRYLTKERFDIIKRSYLINLKMDKVNRYKNIEKYLVNEDWNIENIISDITLEDVNSIFSKYFNNFYISTDKNESWTRK